MWVDLNILKILPVMLCLFRTRQKHLGRPVAFILGASVRIVHWFGDFFLTDADFVVNGPLPFKYVVICLK